MKILRWILIASALIVGLLLAGAYLLPSSIEVERSATVQAPLPVVHAAVTDLDLWLEWEPWSRIDESLEVSFGEIRQGAGALYHWKGDKTGTGIMEIIAVEAEHIDYRYIFNQNEARPAYGRIELHPVDAEQTYVTWSFSSRIGHNPLDRYIGVLVTSMVGVNFEEGLGNLDALVRDIGLRDNQPDPDPVHTH